MKTKVLLLSVFAVAILFSNQMQAQHEEHKSQKKECFLDDLSEDQKTKMEAIKLESHAKIVNYKADVKIKKAELNKLEIAENPSIIDISNKIDEIYVLKAEIEKESAKMHIDIRNELTPDQQKKFDMKKHHVKKNKNMNKTKKSSHGHVNCDKKELHHDCKNK